MKGCTFKRTLPSGAVTWGYSLEAGRDQNGKRKQVFKSGFETKDAADKELIEKLTEKNAGGGIVRPDPRTFDAFVSEWIKEYGPRKCSPKTMERYRSLAACVCKHVGGALLQEITALQLERVFNRLRDAGGYNPKTKKARPLSPLTVRHIAALVNVILKKAIKLKLLKSNPMEGVELPPVPRREAKALDSGKVAWFLDAARSHYSLYEILMFCAGTGCRRGEALALQWPDIDFINREVRFSKSLEQTKEGLRIKPTKTQRTRNISLPASLVELLKLHRKQQEEKRQALGSDYHTNLNLVFCDAVGDYMKPNNVSSKACLIARRAGFPKGISMHTLRHSHASKLLSSGVSLATVAKRLGHTNAHTTATIYAHVLPPDDRSAAEVWNTSFEKIVDATEKVKVS
jgi:integrase